MVRRGHLDQNGSTAGVRTQSEAYRTGDLHFPLVNCVQIGWFVLGSQPVVHDSFDLRLASPGRVASRTRFIYDRMKSDALAFIPRWRRPCRLGDHELMSHSQQVAENIGRDAGQANQYGGVVKIVVGNIIDIRVGCKQFGAIVEADSNHKRTRLSRMVSRQARQQFSAKLECG